LLELLCAIVRDEPFAWPVLDAAAAERLFDVAREHGIHLVVADRIAKRGRLDDCPPPLGERLVTAIRNQVAVDEIARHELRGVLAALAGAGIGPIIFKGTSLAYSHYSDPALRPRVDTDLLVEVDDVPSVGAILERLEYRKLPFVSGDLVMYQVPYVKTDRRGAHHAIDVHWKISNPQVFADALTREELLADAAAVPALGPAARAVGSVHALTVACVHRAAHHGDDERLIWLYDIHLLAEALDAGQQQAFVDLAKAKRLTAVCANALASAERRFHGSVAGQLSAELSSRAFATEEPSEMYVTGRVRKVDVLLSDLGALRGWRQKMKLVREHLFPPRAYMRQAYGVSSPALLPLFYAWRIVRGARAWYRRKS
jgi:hypothetical protein